MYKGTLLVRKFPSLGPNSRPVSRVIVVLGGCIFSDERGSPVHDPRPYRHSRVGPPQGPEARPTRSLRS